MTTTTNNTQPVNSKERKNGNGTTAKAVAAATVVSASAGAGVLADELYRNNSAETPEEVAQVAETNVNPHDVAETQPEAHAETQPAPQPASGHHTAQQHPQEPQPTDHTEETVTSDTPASDDATPTTSSTDEAINTNDLANVNPNVVSADIASAEFIDETDNDAANLPIAGVGTIETPDGDTLAAAALMTGSGETMYLVDVNHDNQYDVVTNDQGTTVQEVQGVITTSDGNELAHINNGTPDQYHGDDEIANDDNGTNIDNEIENNITDIS